MPASIIDGKKIASGILKKLADDVKLLLEQNVIPGLGIFLVGDNPVSKTFVLTKEKVCTQLGIHCEVKRLPDTTTLAELLKEIEAFNTNSAIHGIMVQFPLPKHLEECVIWESILPEKDIDGFHPINRGKLVSGDDTFIPPVAGGIHEILLRSGHHPAGKHIVIIGRSNMVGRPLACLLIQKDKNANGTVTICHSRTIDLEKYTSAADILVVATGKVNTVTGSMIRPGAVVIDVGMNRLKTPVPTPENQFVGDVDFDSVVKVAGAITPVPGGIGPMIIMMIMKNVIKATKNSLLSRYQLRQRSGKI